MTPAQNRSAYLQIADDLRAQILDGSLREGDRLPSESELQADYGVSRIVARQAVEELVKEGLVEKKQGQGSFVRPQAPSEKRIVGDFYGQRPASSPFASAVKAAGGRPEWEYTSRETTATLGIAERLGIEAGDAVMRTTYRFFSGDQPVMLSTSYEPLAITRGTPIQQPEAGPITGVVPRMDSIGKFITDVIEEVVARAPRPHEAEILRVPKGVPVFAISRTYYADDEPVETADIVISADRYELAYRVPLPPPDSPTGP